MTNDDKDIVAAVRSALCDKIGRQRFDLWFSATRLTLRNDEPSVETALLVETASAFAQDCLQANFAKDIQVACTQAVGRPLAIQYRIDPALDQASPTAENDSNGSATKRPRAASGKAPPPASNDDARSTDARSTALRSPPRRFANFNSFVAGDGNRVAVSSAQLIVQQPGCMSPWFVYGPTGAGKTHLLEAIWTAAKQADGGARCVYLSAEQFTTLFVDAVRGSGLPSFRRKYRGVELLIIDDLQFFAGKRATLVELLHTVDVFVREGRQLAFAADRSPAELRALGPELAARLAGGMVCRIDPPDLATRLAILRQLAARMGMTAPEDVLDMIARRLTASARELSGALNRLHATSQALGEPITRPLAEMALAEMFADHGRVVRLGDIDRAIHDVLGIEPETLRSDRKTKWAALPRMLGMWLARKHTRAPLSQIGDHFGGRTHATVISAQKKIEALMNSGDVLQIADQKWPVEEAIRRIEESLRVG